MINNNKFMMNHNKSPYERQCYCPFSFSSILQKKGKGKGESTVEKMVYCYSSNSDHMSF